jgi:fatty acid desaturase
MGHFRIEWPTVGVAAAIGGGFAAVLLGHQRVPITVTIVALAVLGGWYNSLQHEVIHGHPTPWRRLNTALAIVPLGLVVSFGRYREIHLAHHREPELTDPARDPESFYVSAETWQRSGPARRAVHHALRTLAGRLVLGPVVFAWRNWRYGLATTGTSAAVRRVVGHVGGVIAVLVVVQLSGLPVWAYVVGVSWGGGALSLLRSFAEHRNVDAGTRSAVVRSGRFFSLLYLNNNLHHTHHTQPWVPWFELPAAHSALDGDRAAAAGAGLYRGYREVVRRYLVVPFDRPVAVADAPVVSLSPANCLIGAANGLTGGVEPTA